MAAPTPTTGAPLQLHADDSDAGSMAAATPGDKRSFEAPPREHEVALQRSRGCKAARWPWRKFLHRIPAATTFVDERRFASSTAALDSLVVVVLDMAPHRRLCFEAMPLKELRLCFVAISLEELRLLLASCCVGACHDSSSCDEILLVKQARLATLEEMASVAAKLHVFVACALLLLAVGCQASPFWPLEIGYYHDKCPQAEAIVKGVMEKAIFQNPGNGAAMIRMLFHDCFVEGCDASVLLDPTPFSPTPEKLSPPNDPSLRGFELIDAIKDAVEAACPGVVSCADIIAFAARDASCILSRGKVNFDMPSGRRDGTFSNASEPLKFLVPPTSNLSDLVASFVIKGLNTEDLVILSGAHTIGRSHCSSFVSDRLNTPSDINGGLAAFLRGQCPADATPGGNDPTVMQDVVTPNKLDRQYYKNVLSHTVLFTSDAALMTSAETARMVVENAKIPGWWEDRFEKAMVKMAGIEVKTGYQGQIRKNCRAINHY
ncbi:Peroxidase 2 [Hordeum vulgare]|nr:Peroxidase 2 [Hordeum vulgare]